MNEQITVTFLGTGTSTGIPVIGCDCAVCRSTDPRDARTRTSAYVQWGDTSILIDASPELRLQAVNNEIRHVDAVLFTHPHADHVAGFDDLRRFNFINQERLAVYADALTAGVIRERFAYAFENPFPFYGGKPDLDLHIFDGSFELAGRVIVPITVQHGGWVVQGFRFDDFVYLTDAKQIPDEALETMMGADVMVINALRHTPHPVHLSLDEALEFVELVRPREAYIVHVSHELGLHEDVQKQLPAGVFLAYDGLQVTINEEDATRGR